ncbi:MAG: hypothetical protein M3Q70_01195 [bacterium]|nr:hypothetical protein [bacterium]
MSEISSDQTRDPAFALRNFKITLQESMGGSYFDPATKEELSNSPGVPEGVIRANFKYGLITVEVHTVPKPDNPTL